ncbi:protein vav isoform X2 [Euwallacea fornicatus]|uniref:protein vav isoform X2 n=1 Tax=Euwallacea fornicatus TaxID=995702 RepID=UPI00338DC451
MAMALDPHYPDSDELWRECAKWLTRWDMIWPDHKANWDTSTIADLAAILRDGVLLCKLLNKIDPGCMDMKDVNLKPTMAQFLCLRNISLFIKTCKTQFGLGPADMFEESMLFDLTNFHKVLCSLSKLSRSEKALRGGIEGFYAQSQKSREEEVIYQSLTKIQVPPAHTPIGGADAHWRMFTIPCPTVESQEDIYDDLCYVTFQATPPEQTQPQEKRDYVLKELLDTEKNYVDVLNKLKMSFMPTLQSHMKPDDHALVFHKIKELYDVHSSFLLELTKIRTNPNVKLGNVFQQFKEKFLIYGSYCPNLTKATALLQELCDQDDNFNQIVIRVEKEVNNGKFKLRDILSVPMQRILKYHLLLEKLTETTEEHHDEYTDLKRAWEDMLDVARYINEAHRDFERLNVINNLQDNIVEWEHEPDMKLSDYGKLIGDEEVKIKAHDDQKTRNRYVFIFDKCILICKQRNNQFGFRDILNIMEYHVEETHNRAILNNQGRWSYSFLLVKNMNEMAYTVYVRTLEIKGKIIRAISEAQDNVQPRSLSNTNHNFELHTFASAVQCGYCCKYLKGLFFQGYLCHKCNCCVHKTCIQYSGRCGVTSVRLPPTVVNGLDPLKNKLWYVGEMDRSTAKDKLIHRENGTFLVRISPGNAFNVTRSGERSYALSLQYVKPDCLDNRNKSQGIPKHMRINVRPDGSGETKKYYLSESRFFSSIEELVLYYENNSLKENFTGLHDDTKLLYPFHQLRAVVLKNHDAMDRSQLTLRKGQVLSVIGKDGYREGWWKGKTENNEIGYFPVTIINLEGEVRFD